MQMPLKSAGMSNTKRIRFTVSLEEAIYRDLEERANFCYRSVSAEAGILITGALVAIDKKFPVRKVSVATDSAARRTTPRRKAVA